MNTKTVDDIMNLTQGEFNYEHDTGEISEVTISHAVLGRRIVRVANLPPELKAEVLRKHTLKYGTVIMIQEEKWTQNYRYYVDNGVRLVHMELQAHVPSHIHITGHRALVTCTGQPTTCYICNDTSHMVNECPIRKNRKKNIHKHFDKCCRIGL